MKCKKTFYFLGIVSLLVSLETSFVDCTLYYLFINAPVTYTFVPAPGTMFWFTSL